MSYNEKRLKNSETLLRLATQGFMCRVREVGEALTICTMEDVKVITEQLIELVEAMESCDADIEYYKEQCRKELR